MIGKQDDRFPYWRQHDYVQNFGDYLTQLFLTDLFEPDTTSDSTFHLVGSSIASPYIRNCLNRWPERPVVFWSCGKRDGETIHADLMTKCRFPAVRGPLTRDALGLKADTPIGDAGLLLPLFYDPLPAPRHARRTLCVPHIADPLSDGALLARTGADMVVRAAIPRSLGALRETIDAIASAEFVLAGALHAAICACAYQVPFCFLDTGYIDVPFKWRDFAASIHIAPRFGQTAADARQIWRDSTAPNLRRPPLHPLLEVAPIRLRAGMLGRAASHDDYTQASNFVTESQRLCQRPAKREPLSRFSTLKPA